MYKIEYVLNIEPASLQWLKPIQFIIENLESHEAYYKNMRAIYSSST